MKALIGPIFLALLLAGCGAKDSGDPSDDTNAVAEVETAVATPGGAAETIPAYGFTEQGPGNERALTTQSEATVARIEAPNGTSVGAGQVVAVLNPSANARLDFAKASTDARSASDVLARAIRLRKDGLDSNADVNSAKAAYSSAEETLKAARQRGATLILRAPVAGTVQGMTARPGDLVAAGTTVATIGARGNLRVHLEVDPATAARVRTGEGISISAVNANGQVATSVIGVDPQIDPATHLASIYARLPAGQPIGPGQPVKAVITLARAGSGVIVPYSALLDDGGHAYVFVVKNGVAKRRDVTPGNSSSDTIQILQGLGAGERVVTQGGTALDDGMKVHEQGTPAAAPPKGEPK